MIRVVEVLAVIGVATLLLLGWYLYCRRNGRAFGPRLYSSSVTLGVFVFLRVLTLLTLIRAAYIGNYDHILLCVLTLLLISMPSILERALKVTLPTTMEVIILCFVFAAEILGEVNHYYTLVNGWDTALHTLNGFLCAAVGFALVDLLNRSERTSLKLSPEYLAVVAFCFSMTVGTLWEFLEFAADRLFLLDMQKDYIVTSFSSAKLGSLFGTDVLTVQGIAKTTITLADGQTYSFNGYLDIGIIDTMKDLLVNLIGAVTFSVIGFLYEKQKSAGGIASQFIPRVTWKGGEQNASDRMGDHEGVNRRNG